jgi:hypothetical protein
MTKWHECPKYHLKMSIRIKSFQIWLKNNYENDMHKMMCDYKNNVVIQLFYNYIKLIISNLIWIQMDIINYNM